MSGDASAGRVPPRLGGGRFVVCDRLGDGGTAGVYLAWDTETSRWTALKAMLFAHLKDADMRQRFRAEAQTMALLDHPHVARILHHDVDAMPPYLVMELARCGSAMAWVKEHGPMPPSLAVDVLVQMCEALHTAHEAGVVHRDVKPHNFLLDDQGVCKLTDFGIARVDDNTSMTATGSQIGTFSFMAPEQRSDTKRVDLRADVYALGSSLYTLLTARTSAELFIAQDDESILERVPAPFQPVLIKACQYQPDDRYDDVLQFQTALLSGLSRLPSDQGDYPPLVRASEPLPAGPPDRLPDGVDLDDLMKCMALDLDNPTYVPKGPVPELLPPAQPAYQMARPSTPPPGAMGALGTLPSYLDASEVAKEQRRESAMEASRVQHEVEKASRARSERARRQREAHEPSRIPEMLLGGAALFVALAVLVLGGGAVHVWMSASATDAASNQFTTVLQSESAVVYELGGDRRFEELYTTYDEAQGPTRIAAAVAFADALEREMGKRAMLDPRVKQRAQRILTARDDYASAYEAWRSAAGAFPGSLAVGVGIASGPGG